MTDLKVIFEKFLAGDNAAFAELYREMNPRLSAYCWKLSSGNTEDLMQELWERVIAMRSRSSQAGSGVESPAAFLFRMLKNLVIDKHRKGRNEIPLDAEMTDESYTTHSSFSTKSEELSDIECIVLDALEKLRPDDHELLILNFYSGYNYGEIAEMLGVSQDAIWQRASRAKIRLKKIVIAETEKMHITIPNLKMAAKPARKETTKI